MIRILHLTDFHLNQKNLKDWKSFLREAFLNKIKALDRKRALTIIAFTGDLIDLGGADFKDIQTAFDVFKTEVIDPIIAEVGFDIEKFLIVPGNHDVLRSLDDKRSELGSLAYFKENYENISDYIISANKNDDFQGMERIKPFKRFEKELYKDVNNYNYSLFGSSYKFTAESEKIGICCLNSSWRCYDKNDLGKLIIGEDQLVQSFNHIKDCE